MKLNAFMQILCSDRNDVFKYIQSLSFFFSVSGDAEAVGSESVSHPTYVQYVEGDGSAYIPANGQM